MIPRCFGSNPALCKSEATAKADMGQGFKDPETVERDRASSRTVPLSHANTLTLQTKRFCPRKSSLNSALRSPVSSHRGLTTCPRISENSTGIPGPLGNIPASNAPAPLSFSPCFARCCCKAFGDDHIKWGLVKQ